MFKTTTTYSPFLRFWKCSKCEMIDDYGINGVCLKSICPQCGTEISYANTMIGRWKITTYPDNPLLVDCEPDFEFVPKDDAQPTYPKPVMPESKTIKEFTFGRKDFVVLVIAIGIFACSVFLSIYLNN